MESAGALVFILTLPERALRALAVLIGGLVYETAEVLLPGWLRRTRLYRATIGGLLRITIELVGGLNRVVAPDELEAQELAVRKAAGSVVELAGFLAMGLSPMWLFAAAADITGGTRIYLDALVSELRDNDLLPRDADITTVDELLDSLEDTSGQMADMFDVPPLNITDLRNSLRALKGSATDLPEPGRLASLFHQLQQVAAQEKRSLLSISSLIAAGATRAGAQVGKTFVFDYYHEAIGLIKKEGVEYYSRRVSRPYLSVAKTHFDPKRLTYTGRLLRKVRNRAY